MTYSIDQEAIFSVIIKLGTQHLHSFERAKQEAT